ncbi:hypothetical protein N803_01245 [Knoellia subterranea KCTC 19937]|uniref:Protein-glutamine gamma-glutamyltransferase-like C-terminal domain-containing protein n=1 Tax=Knoellia subterranea KCTC 19937 TaxID=1385521 RepID=A0A0A0JQ61_9MICO|nr:hypothetical protein N803_01245 [Knoellia subterranea KCTC 19937]
MGTACALLLSAWVSGAGSISAFTRPTMGPPATEEHGEVFDQGQTDNGSQAGPRQDGAESSHIVTEVVVWTLRLLLVLLVATIAYLLVRAFLRRLRRDVVQPKEEVRAGVLPDVLVDGLRSSEAELDRGTSSEAVINAWLALERTAVAVGVDDDRSRTPAELVGAVLADYDVDRNTIESLAALYREARFSVHPIGEHHRAAARAALQRIREDLAVPLQFAAAGADVGAGAGVGVADTPEPSTGQDR